MKTVIKIENQSKVYLHSEISAGTLSNSMTSFFENFTPWAHMYILRQDSTYPKVGHVNDHTQKAEKGKLVAALNDINIKVKEEEVLGIIGKNILN